MSSKNETAELLQIPPGTARPTAYQILGLEPLERDAQRVAAAVRARAAHLKAQKGSASPAAWKAAAAAYEKARSILTDAAVKEKYDQQLRRELAESRPASPPAQSAATTHDLPPALAGVLPATDPSAPFDPQAYLRDHPELAAAAEDEEDIDQLLFGDEQSAADSPDAADAVPAVVAASPATPPPIPTVAHQPRRRRRSLPLANLAMGLVVILLFVGIGATLYALVRQDEDRGPEITAADPAPLEPRAEREPEPRSEPRSPDPVMGNLPAAASAPPITRGGSDSEFRMPQPNGTESSGAEPDADDAPPMTSEASPSQDRMTMETVVEQPTPEPNRTASSTESSASMAGDVAAGEEALEQAKNAVRANAWDEVEAASDAATAAAATSDQRQQARLLDRLVSYALEYRRAIRAGGQKIGAGESFELQPGVRVGMVENSEDRVVIRVSGRNRSYDGYDDLPPVLEHAFARMDLDADHPTTSAYKAAYQAISQQSTPEHRQQAFDWWQQAAAESDEIDVEGLQELVQQLYPESRASSDAL